MKIILTDVDETVLKFAQPFQDWAATKNLHGDGRLIDNYCIRRHYGVSRPHADVLVREFSDGSAFRTQPPEECALDVLPRLHANGWQFVAISACHDSPEAIENRRANLRDAFGFDFLAVHATGLGNSKQALLRAYQPTVWVEDHAGNAILGAAVGHRSFLLTRPYNVTEGLPGAVSRVRDWHDVERAILEAGL